MILVDTNVISETLRQQPDPAVVGDAGGGPGGGIAAVQGIERGLELAVPGAQAADVLHDLSGFRAQAVQLDLKLVRLDAGRLGAQALNGLTVAGFAQGRFDAPDLVLDLAPVFRAGDGGPQQGHVIDADGNPQRLQQGIDLDLRVGRRVAIVGPSGIGKSTLLATLAGLLEPRGGTLTLDGVPPWQAARSEVAARVCLTAEDAHVFHTSVLENLRVARGDVTPAEAGELLRRAGLGRWLEALPEGVETIIGTDATTLSGGERRRLLLARALAAPAPLMLLDEPGEHLDAVTADRLVTDLLTAGDQGRGTLLVTHRLSALEHADEVLVMGHRPQAAGEQAPATILHRGSHRDLQDVSETYRWSLSQEDQDRQQDHVSGTS